MIRKILLIASIAAWLVFGLILPAIGYHKGTSKDVSVKVIAEPFQDSETLIYEWSGHVNRSCPIEIRRHILDSNDVITYLSAFTFGALPADELGPKTYEISVDMPLFIAEGAATYYVAEVPKCSWLQRLRPNAVSYPPVHFTVTR